MPHLALARKWRPQRFEDVIGQRGVVDTLKNAILSDRLAQSFIFAGPRGVGKTTTARILARALNCVQGPTPEPCGVCDACREIAESGDMDVFEIDAATHTGIDAVREVIVEPLAIAPIRDRFKIFIIDEVHRLSKHAFDALLKSIEEPPPYVKFMMATTDLHAVPATIQSRSQVFELRTLPVTSIAAQLKAVTTDEHVAIDDAAVALLARSAEGSMRDALGALDQVLAFTTEHVTARDVSTVLGIINRDLQLDIVDVVAREDVAAAFDLAATVVESGVDLRAVCRELARVVRDLLVIGLDPGRLADPDIAAEHERERLRALAARFSREDLMRSFDLLSRAEYDIRQSSQPRHQFEMALVKWIHLRHLTPLTEVIEQMGSDAPAGASPRPVAPRPASVPAPAHRAPAIVPPARPTAPSTSTSASGAGVSDAPRPPQPVLVPPAPRPTAAPMSSEDARARPAVAPAASERPRDAVPDAKFQLLSAIREQNKIFYGMVIMQAAEVEIEGDAIVFTFTSSHKSLRGELERKRSWIEQIAQTTIGRRLRVEAREVAAEAPAVEPDRTGHQKDLRDRAKADPAVQSMLDVFGGDVEDVEEIT